MRMWVSLFFFFFSSRRRHTRCSRDWSSDVCSSDLELSRGETSIQLATDKAPYWESERPRLLPPGQRGSGVEIVLLVDNVEAVYRQAQSARADIARPLADFPWHMRQFWVRHPDGYLIRPAQRILSVNPAAYHRQVSE